MARIAIVNCGVPNGLRLTLGTRHVVLDGGQNRVDADFWEAWIAESTDYPPVVAGTISGSVVDEPEPVVEPEPAPTTEPEPA